MVPKIPPQLKMDQWKVEKMGSRCWKGWKNGMPAIQVPITGNQIPKDKQSKNKWGKTEVNVLHRDIKYRCIIVLSKYVLSPYVWSVMWCPLDSVTCCFVHFTIGPSDFLHGLTVFPWVLIDFVTFGPKLLLLSPRGKERFWKFWQFRWRFTPQTFWFPSKHCTTVLCLLGALGSFWGRIRACCASAICVWPA